MKTFKLNLSRGKLYWIGISILSFYYLLNKLDFLMNAEFTQGRVVSYEMLGNMNTARVEFFVNKPYYLNAVANVQYATNEKIKVIYSERNPSKAYIFSFLGFWYEGLIVCLVPLVIWSAFVFSFFQKNDKIILLEKQNSEAQNFFSKNKQLD